MAGTPFSPNGRGGGSSAEGTPVFCLEEAFRDQGLPPAVMRLFDNDLPAEKAPRILGAILHARPPWPPTEPIGRSRRPSETSRTCSTSTDGWTSPRRAWNGWQPRSSSPTLSVSSWAGVAGRFDRPPGPGQRAIPRPGRVLHLKEISRPRPVEPLLRPLYLAQTGLTPCPGTLA